MPDNTVRHSMIGQILQSFGRISEEQVEEALEYQKLHGGYFGEALLALDLVTREELDWGLASQFDMPYVFPDADSIDPDATALVTPEWALANLTLPILKTPTSLTVIVDTPLWSEAVEELQNKTNLTIDLGLASSSKIRELIREVYGVSAPDAADDAAQDTQGLEAFFSHAIAAGASRFGISVRGQRATGWYEQRGRTPRVGLDGAWNTDLENLLSPPPIQVRTGADQDQWSAELIHEGKITRVGVHCLSGGGGEEYVFEPSSLSVGPQMDPPDAAILSEIRVLVASGSARFVVTTTPESMGPELLHHLPNLLLGADARTVAVTDRGEVDEGLFVRTVSSEEGAREQELAGLSTFRFDAVSVDLSGDPKAWIDPVLDVAQTAFVLWNEERDRQVAHVAGVRWQLKIEERLGNRLEWVLQPLRI